MRFQKNTLGYLKLGIIFIIFSIIPSAILGAIGTPLILGGMIAGGSTGLGISMLVLAVFAIFIQGWFVYWFYTNNKFVRR
jgi:hypothetical protein